MLPFDQFPEDRKKDIGFVLTDIDDTLTHKGRLIPVAYAAMERLQQNRIRVVPITGRPAGWCDHMARMWPIDAIVGENGAFYFRYDRNAKKMIRRYAKETAEREADREQLQKIAEKILATVPGCRVSADQAFRVADLAIDFCEDVPPLPEKKLDRIVHIFKAAGAQVKISSIHINGWFGDYDKQTMTALFFKEIFGVELEKVKDRVLFSGDSPNDAPMFAYFPESVGMANIVAFQNRLTSLPAWVTSRQGGYGFAEMVDILLTHPRH